MPYNKWHYSTAHSDGGALAPAITDDKGEEIVTEGGLGCALAVRVVIEHNLLHWIINSLLTESQLDVIPPDHVCRLREFESEGEFKSEGASKEKKATFTDVLISVEPKSLWAQGAADARAGRSPRYSERPIGYASWHDPRVSYIKGYRFVKGDKP